MKKLLWLFVMLVFICITVSCSQDKDEAGSMPKMVDVGLSIKPEKGKLDKPIIFEAKVTQGSEKINDADVTFEVWRAKDEKHEKIAIKNPKNGVYRLEKSFRQEGTYYIISHVTARDMHNMPKKEFTVGKPSVPEETEPDDSKENMNMDDHNDHENSEGH